MRRHPCWDSCATRLSGIVDQVNRNEGTNLELVSIRSVFVAGETVIERDRGELTFSCPHNRLYHMRLRRRAGQRSTTSPTPPERDR